MGTQTGGGSVGAAAASFAIRIPTTGGNYYALQIITSAGVNAAGISETLLFGVTY